MTTRRHPRPAPVRTLLVVLLSALACTGCGDSAPPVRELPADFRGAPLMQARGAADSAAEVAAAAPDGRPAPATSAGDDPEQEGVVRGATPSEEFMSGGTPAVSLEGGAAVGPGEASDPRPELPDKEPTTAGDAELDVAIGDVDQHVDPTPTGEDEIPFLSFDELASFRYVPEGLEEYGTIGHDNPEHAGGAAPAEGEAKPGDGRAKPGDGGTKPAEAGTAPEGIPPPEGVTAPETPKNEIPAAIKKLDGKVVSIEGYMIPIEFDDGLVTEFILSRFIMGCCFGVVPAPNELVDVVMEGEEGAEYEAFLPIIVTGKLTIRGGDDKPGYMQGLYKLDGTTVRVAEPK